MTKPNDQFLEYVLELLEPAGSISSGRMFGGYVIRKSGLPIALIIRDEVYFKVDDSNRADYEALGSEPFTYKAKGKTVAISNWMLPVDELEDPDRMMEWVDKSYKVAMKSKKR